MSALKVLILTIVVASLAVISGQSVLFHLTDVLVATLALSAVWCWLTPRGLRVERTLRQDRAQVGDEIEQRLQLRARLPVPRVWIEFVDSGTLPGYRAGRVLGIGLGGSRTWLLRATCRRRGLYQLGPARIHGTDPFGLFHSTHRDSSVRSVLVYPATVELSGLALPAGHLVGGDRRRGGWHQTTSHVSGVRDYHPGDPVHHIHWRSTAHAGRMMVKEFDVEPVADLWLFLDAEQSVQRGEGDDSTEEYGVTVAASLARHFLGEGRAVGMVAVGRQRVVVPTDRGQRQLIKILEELAMIRASGDEPIAETLASEGDRCTRNAAVIVVTPSLDERWPASLRALRDRGIASGAIVLEPSTFGDAPGSLLLVGALAACSVPSILIKRGDDLSRTLSDGWRG